MNFTQTQYDSCEAISLNLFFGIATEKNRVRDVEINLANSLSIAADSS